MKRLTGVIGAAALLAGAMSSAQAAVVVGTYSFESSELVDQVLSFSGTGMYNGTNYINPAVSTADITDTDSVYAPITYVATAPYAGYDDVSLGLGFGQTNVVNGAGADIALFFLFDQSNNQVDVTLNGVTNSLTFASVYNGSGTQQVADGVTWNGTTLDNVLVTVAEVDLSSFGIADGALFNGGFTVGMNQTGAASEVVALSMVGALNTTVVPVPAAVWLFGSGLLGLVGIARRRS